jgi:hypothetical protein
MILVDVEPGVPLLVTVGPIEVSLDDGEAESRPSDDGDDDRSVADPDGDGAAAASARDALTEDEAGERYTAVAMVANDKPMMGPSNRWLPAAFRHFSGLMERIIINSNAHDR